MKSRVYSIVGSRIGRHGAVPIIRVYADRSVEWAFEPIVNVESSRQLFAERLREFRAAGLILAKETI